VFSSTHYEYFILIPHLFRMAGERKKKEIATTKTTTRKKKTTATATPLRSNPRRKVTTKKVIPASTPKPSPKKKPTTKRTTKKKDLTKKPTYKKMIFRALKALKDQASGSGLSSKAIGKYIQENFPVPEETAFRRYLRVALKKSSDNGNLIRRGQSYRMSAKAKTPRKAITKKKATRKRKTSTSSTITSRRKSTSTPTKPTKKRTTANSTSSSSSSPSPSSTPTKKRTAKETTKAIPKKRKTSPSSISSPSSKETVVKKVSGIKGDHIWQYDEKGTWKNYETEASNVVEEVYQKYLANRGDTDVRAVKSGQWEYMVDFMAMKQTNIQHENHTVRNIRRVKLS